jgi:hypothetical protein
LWQTHPNPRLVTRVPGSASSGRLWFGMDLPIGLQRSRSQLEFEVNLRPKFRGNPGFREIPVWRWELGLGCSPPANGRRAGPRQRGASGLLARPRAAGCAIRRAAAARRPAVSAGSNLKAPTRPGRPGSLSQQAKVSACSVWLNQPAKGARLKQPIVVVGIQVLFSKHNHRV